MDTIGNWQIEPSTVVQLTCTNYVQLPSNSAATLTTLVNSFKYFSKQPIIKIRNLILLPAYYSYGNILLCVSVVIKKEYHICL